MSEKTICPVCGACALTHAVRDQPYTYKGRETIIEAVEADWCEACGESLTGPGETDKVMAAMRVFQRQVNADLVSPDFVRTVRSLGSGLPFCYSLLFHSIFHQHHTQKPARLAFPFRGVPAAATPG